jgi:hypothetical protein
MATFRIFRVGLLLLALVAAVSWAISDRRQRLARTEWVQPLQVAVVLMAEGPLSADVVKAWDKGGRMLELWVHDQFAAHRGGEGRPPVRFEVIYGVTLTQAPPFRPNDESLWARARHLFQLQRFLWEVHKQAGMNPRGYDARIYVHLQPRVTRGSQFVEGVGEAGGVVGLVKAPIDEKDLTLPLSAVVHELFHCLGATDKYDANGHAVEPDGLAEPEASPLYPQKYAEIMVGERPLGPSRGTVPRKLSEVSVGPLTALELRWTTTLVTAP